MSCMCMKDSMKREIKPSIYNSFHCIAGACSYTCCQQWRIGVDEETQKKWNSLLIPEIQDNSGKRRKAKLSSCIVNSEGESILKLGSDHFCRLLDEEHLCRVVKQYGDACIPEACRLYPRQIQNFPDRTEFSLNPGCPEVVRLLAEYGAKLDVSSFSDQENDHLLTLRLFMHQILCSEDYSLSEALYVCQFLLEQASCEEHGNVSEKTEKWKKCSASLRISLNSVPQALPGNEASLIAISGTGLERSLRDLPIWKRYLEEMKSLQPSAEESLAEQNDLFLDLTAAYREQGMYSAFLEELCPAAEEFDPAKQEESLRECSCDQQKISEKLLKNIAATELFACGAPGEGLYELRILFQWVCLEIAAIRHAVLLSSLLDKVDGLKVSSEKKVPAQQSAQIPEWMEQSIVILARIMGFCHEDIFDYMEECFEEPLWSRDYLALIHPLNKKKERK